jgi:integrase
LAVYKTERNGRIIWNVKIRYDTWNGERKQKKKEGFTTRREAQQWEIDFLNSCKSDVTMSFSNLVDKYMEDCYARLAPTTMAGKKHMIETKLLPYFGKMPLNEINVATVRMWQNAIITDPAGYRQTYLKTIHNQLSAIMNFAVKYYGLPKNPASQCGSMGKKHADTMQFWTLDEFNQLIVAVDDLTAWTAFYLLFYSGMREGEFLALTLSDFDFTANTVSITKNYAQVHGMELIKEPKTPKSKRTVTIPKPVMDMVREYADRIYDYNVNDRLFPINKNKLYSYMVKYTKLSGVKKIRVHDIRHSHASMLIELGVAPLAISERLGHEDIQTTLNTYSHLYPNKQNEIANLLAQQIPMR